MARDGRARAEVSFLVSFEPDSARKRMQALLDSEAVRASKHQARGGAGTVMAQIVEVPQTGHVASTKALAPAVLLWRNGELVAASRAIPLRQSKKTARLTPLRHVTEKSSSGKGERQAHARMIAISPRRIPLRTSNRVREVCVSFESAVCNLKTAKAASKGTANETTVTNFTG